MSKFSDMVLGHANCVAYWPLNTHGNDLKGTNNLTLTDVTFTPNGAYFNGTNAFGASAAIDLTGTDKITLIAELKIVTYNITGSSYIFETSVDSSINAGAFQFVMLGTTANDPIRLLVRGDIGNNSAHYFPTDTHLDDGQSVFSAIIGDYSKGVGNGNEVDYYQNGLLKSKTNNSSSDNTGNFGNHVLYVGARAGSSSWSNISVKNLALFNNVLTANEINNFYTALRTGGSGSKYFGDTSLKRRSLSKYWRGEGIVHAFPLAGSMIDEVGSGSIDGAEFNGGSAHFDELSIPELLGMGGASSTVLMFVKDEFGYELKTFRTGDDTILSDVTVREILIFNKNLNDYDIADYETWARGQNRMIN